MFAAIVAGGAGLPAAAYATDGGLTHSWLQSQQALLRAVEVEPAGPCELAGQQAEEPGLNCPRSWLPGLVQAAVSSAFAASSQLLAQSDPYRHGFAGDGDQGMMGKSPYGEGVNCTTSMEALVHAMFRGGNTATCWKDPFARYLPGMEGAYFGRAHFYETQWRANAIRRGFARDVSHCVNRGRPRPRSCGDGAPESYRFRTTGTQWQALIQGQLGGSKGSARLFAEHLRQTPAEAARRVERLRREDCPSLAALNKSARADWPSDLPADTGDCSSPEGAALLASGYLEVVRRVRVEVIESLDATPLEASVPCVGFGRDPEPFDPERELPSAWRREGASLLVAFVSSRPGKGSIDHPLTGNDRAVTHQGVLVFRQGEWWLRHASPKSAGAGFVETRFGDYVRNSSFVGMNLLAPAN